MTDWNKIKYFTKEEFYSPDCKCDKINHELVEALDYVRQQIEIPMKVNSGYRSPEHNEKVGGSKTSQHLLGNAADIVIDSKEMGDAIEYWFKDYVGDECGIGRYDDRYFIHLDVRGKKARW